MWKRSTRERALRIDCCPHRTAQVASRHRQSISVQKSERLVLLVAGRPFVDRDDLRTFARDNANLGLEDVLLDSRANSGAWRPVHEEDRDAPSYPIGLRPHDHLDARIRCRPEGG